MTQIASYAGKNRIYQTITISASAASSQTLSLSRLTLVGLITPAAMTGTSITFNAASSEDGTYRNLVDSDGNALTVAIAADRHIVLDPSAFIACDNIQLVSNQTEAAERELTLVLYPV